jgi:hypothetical protein
MKFKIGDKVACNGNPDGRVIALKTEYLEDYGDDITWVTVRLWDGTRIVGETVASESSLAFQNNKE